MREVYDLIDRPDLKYAPFTAGGPSELAGGHDLFEALQHQDSLQTLYTGGTVFHGFLGERLEDWRSARLMVRRIAENFHLPYFTISPTFTICPVHGYIQGEHFTCPHHHDQAA